MKKNSIIQFLCSLVLLLPFLTACSDDSTEEIEGIFRPKIVTGYPIADANTIKLLWYDIEDAESYDVEYSYNEDYSDPIKQETVEDVAYTTQKLPYGTKIYLRVKANSKRNGYVSAWREVAATTEERDIPQILKEVDDDEITETSAIIRWNIDSQYPVDGIEVVSLTSLPEGGSPEPRVISLTDEEGAKGYYELKDLEKTTSYKITLFNSKIEDIYERTYNNVTFKTAGPPAGSTVIKAGDDLSAILKAAQADANVGEGQVYYLEGDATFDLEGMAFTKGFSLVGAIGSDITINIKAPFVPTGTPGTVEFNNVKLIGSTLLICNTENDGLDFNWAGLKITKCALSGFASGGKGGLVKVCVSKGNMKEIASISIDECIFDGMEQGRLFDTDLNDNSTKYLQLTSMSITNTTFINSPKLALIYLHDAYGQAGCTINFTMTNITAYESLAQNGRVIQMNRLTQASVVNVSNCLFSIEENTVSAVNVFTETCLVGSAVKNYSNNYITGELAESERSNSLQCSKYPKKRNDLFADPANGDLTIKDHTSIIYTDKVGDPRWLK